MSKRRKFSAEFSVVRWSNVAPACTTPLTVFMRRSARFATSLRNGDTACRAGIASSLGTATVRWHSTMDGG